MSHTINTVAARTKLKPRREPYWHRISKGFYLGFRKMTATSAGTWVLRTTSDDNTKDTYKTLGDYPELADNQRFDAAMTEATKLVEHIGKGDRTALWSLARRRCGECPCDAGALRYRETPARLSTDRQSTENQLRELRQTAQRLGWDVVGEFVDTGISGANGRKDRPQLDAMLKGVSRKDFDVVASWSVDRLGRSLIDLVSLL